MAIKADYLGMPLSLDDLDGENLAYFKHCAAHDFHLQQCEACNLLRYPPTTACPWCMSPKAKWVPVEGKGAVHSYTEVHHAIQPAFKAHTPYLILLVDLDTQKGKPTEHEALRVVGNLATPDGKLAPPDTRQDGRHRHARAHGVLRRGAGSRAAALDHRRECRATRQAVAVSAGVTAAKLVICRTRHQSHPSSRKPTLLRAIPSHCDCLDRRRARTSIARCDRTCMCEQSRSCE